MSYHPDDITLYGDMAVWARVPESERHRCSYTDTDGFCVAPATHHIAWDFRHASPVCAGHKAIVEERGDFLGIHEFDPSVCPHNDAEFDGDHNRCVLRRLSH